MRYTISPLSTKQASKLLAFVDNAEYKKYVSKETGKVILKITSCHELSESFARTLKKMKAKIVCSEALEESCASCDKCSVRGRYCYLHKTPVNLDSICDFHSNIVIA